jgi:hypothetical protein
MLNYAFLTRALLEDLLELGAERDFAVSFARWFHPMHKEYVARVSEWQQFLCVGTASELSVGPLLVRYKVAQCWGEGFALRPDVHPFRVFVVHQLALLYWKEEIPVDPDWSSFKDRLASSGTPDLDHPIVAKLAEWCRTLLGKAPTWDEIEGTCGSGATAERRTLRDRWYFDSTPLGIPANFYHYNDRDITPQKGIIPWARASAVPKNRKSARIVASECAAAMYAQLGVMKALDKRIKLLGRRVPLRNADIHRMFLRRHDVATLDLSDASDYVSMDLANAILPTDWATLCNACRSQVVVTPDGDCIRLATYAPMGNGFCFRILSLVCAGILAVTTRHAWSDFGDDMICHRSDVPYVALGLEVCGLRLNTNKSCYGQFVESCGTELFKGIDITPLKLKRLLTFNDHYVDIGAAARAASRNLHHLAVACYDRDFPYRTRYNRYLQCSEMRLPCWKTQSVDYECDDWSGMLRWYAQRGENFRECTEEYARTSFGFKWCRNETDALLQSDIDDIRARLAACLPTLEVRDLEDLI